jgi:hypothetical protein
MERMTRLITVVLLALLVGGCAAGNYGKVTRNGEVDRVFISGSLPSGYQYYYIGEKTHPPAILGIQNGYSLETRFWTAIDLDSSQLAEWRAYFRESTGKIEQSSRARLRFSGYTLLDPKGMEVGIIYSIYPWIVTIFPKEKVVTVYPPEPYVKDPLLIKAQ